jgi:hypothetical protein
MAVKAYLLNDGLLLGPVEIEIWGGCVCDPETHRPIADHRDPNDWVTADPEIIEVYEQQKERQTRSHRDEIARLREVIRRPAEDLNKIQGQMTEILDGLDGQFVEKHAQPVGSGKALAEVRAHLARLAESERAAAYASALTRRRVQ